MLSCVCCLSLNVPDCSVPDVLTIVSRTMRLFFSSLLTNLLIVRTEEGSNTVKANLHKVVVPVAHVVLVAAVTVVEELAHVDEI